MEKFIVWDAYMQCFYDGKNNGINVFKLNQDGTLSYYDACYDDDYANKFYTPFKSIGLKDKNGKSIYLDSSICKVNYFSSSDWISDYCYFSFDTENFRCVVHLINEKEIVDYEASCFDCLEIIDTIQENKLGLIK